MITFKKTHKILGPETAILVTHVLGAGTYTETTEEELEAAGFVSVEVLKEFFQAWKYGERVSLKSREIAFRLLG